jgi:hypothetical protein
LNTCLQFLPESFNRLSTISIISKKLWLNWAKSLLLCMSCIWNLRHDSCRRSPLILNQNKLPDHLMLPPLLLSEYQSIPLLDSLYFWVFAWQTLRKLSKTRNSKARIKDVLKCSNIGIKSLKESEIQSKTLQTLK